MFKKFFISILFVLFVSTPLLSAEYSIQWLKSPDRNYPDISIRGVNNNGQFSATLSKRPDGVQIGHFNQYDLKGLFGKIKMVSTKSRGEFEFSEAYDPPYKDQIGVTPWNMGFSGMSENSRVTSLAFEKYEDFNAVPKETSVLRWNHMFNSLGWSTFDDVHRDYTVISECKGDLDWKGGLANDINSNGRVVGFLFEGDAFLFNTNNGEFEVKWQFGEAPFGSHIRLWGISDNDWAIGDGEKAGEPSKKNFIVNVYTKEVRWLVEEHPDVHWEPGYFDPNAAINNYNDIVFIGSYQGQDGFVRYNFDTYAIELLTPFHPTMLDYDEIYFCDMSSDPDAPILVGYGFKEISPGEWRADGWIMFPKIQQ